MIWNTNKDRRCENWVQVIKSQFPKDSPFYEGAKGVMKKWLDDFETAADEQREYMLGVIPLPKK